MYGVALADRALKAMEQRAWVFWMAWLSIRLHSVFGACATVSTSAPWLTVQADPAASDPTTEATREFVLMSTYQPATDAGADVIALSRDCFLASSCAALSCTTLAVAPAACTSWTRDALLTATTSLPEALSYQAPAKFAPRCGARAFSALAAAFSWAIRACAASAERPRSRCSAWNIPELAAALGAAAADPVGRAASVTAVDPASASAMVSILTGIR